MTSRVRDGYVEDNDQFWAVRIDRVNGPGFALNGEGSRYLFGTQKAANEFCRELKEHIESPCSVVQVNVSIREVRRRPVAVRSVLDG